MKSLVTMASALQLLTAVVWAEEAKPAAKPTAAAVAAPKKVDPANPDGQVEIVKDLKGAKNADIGYLSLRTVNPSSANVLMNGDELGSTPLSKVPVEAGVHKLRLIDGDGKPRMLSITIEAGKTNEMRAVDVSSLPVIPSDR